MVYVQCRRDLLADEPLRNQIENLAMPVAQLGNPGRKPQVFAGFTVLAPECTVTYGRINK